MRYLFWKDARESKSKRHFAILIISTVDWVIGAAKDREFLYDEWVEARRKIASAVAKCQLCIILDEVELGDIFQWYNCKAEDIARLHSRVKKSQIEGWGIP